MPLFSGLECGGVAGKSRGAVGAEACAPRCIGDVPFEGSRMHWPPKRTAAGFIAQLLLLLLALAIPGT